MLSPNSGWSDNRTAIISVTHQYDAAGNLQSDGLHQYHYDSQGRLQSSQTGQGPDAPTTRYAHNALGQRVFKTEPLYAAASSKDGALDEEEDPGLLQTLVDFFTRLWNPAKSDAEHLGWAYVYDEEGSLLGEYGMGGAQSAGQSQYLYLPTAQGPIPIAAEIDNRLYAIHTDHLGTPRRLTQADGQAAWQWAYTPYGDEAPTLGAKRFTNETTNPSTGSTGIAPVRFNLRYPGQYFDEESGLHYNYFRSYDPRTGRYTQGDPIGLEGGWNRYSYVGGNPLSRIDPMGLWEVADIFPEGAPILPIGRALGGVFAYTQGVLIGNKALADAAMEGLQCSRAENMDALGVVLSMGRAKGGAFPKGGPPRDPKTANYLPYPDAVGPHTTLGTRSGRNGDYTQGATFDRNGRFMGRTDVTNHGRGDHTNPHWHPAVGPNSVGSAQPIP